MEFFLFAIMSKYQFETGLYPSIIDKTRSSSCFPKSKFCYFSSKYW